MSPPGGALRPRTPQSLRMDLFTAVALGAAIAAGAVAAVAGFGIGSILTPVLSTQVDVRLAIAAVSLPHLVGTAVRFLLVRTHIDRDVLVGFGLASAIGGLAGAALQAVVQSAVLAIVFAALLLFAGVSSLTGLSQRLRFRGRGAALVGGAAGADHADHDRRSVRARSHDALRVSTDVAGNSYRRRPADPGWPRYTVRPDGWRCGVRRRSITGPLILILSVGATIGTLAGQWTLRRMPERVFRRVVGVLLLLLGLYTLARVVA